jgi:hypothetical protein
MAIWTCVSIPVVLNGMETCLRAIRYGGKAWDLMRFVLLWRILLFGSASASASNRDHGVSRQVEKGVVGRRVTVFAKLKGHHVYVEREFIGHFI